MRVMMIGPYPRSPDRIDGGVAAAITYLSQSLASQPDVELIAVRIAGDGSRHQGDFGWPMIDMPLGRMSLSTLYVRQKRQFRDLVRHHRPDLIHGQGTDLSGFLAVGGGLPSVVTVHGLLAECAKFQTNPVTKIRASLTALATEGTTVRRTRNLIAISPYVTQYYRTSIRGRVHDIPNAVAPAFFRVDRMPERGRLLFAGRIAHGKGLIDLLRAVAQSGQSITKVVLAGAAPDPDYAAKVRAEASDLNLSDRIEFAGLLDEPALLNEFARAEALVLPSYQETAPMVVQQAMAAGLAVIATSVGGIPFQIEHDSTGLLFEPGDVTRFASLIERLADDPSLSVRLGERARATATRAYTADSIASATRAVYESVLSAARSPIASGNSEWNPV